MLRALKIVLVVALVVTAAVTLADVPGTVSMVWLGYHIETSVAFLLLVVALIAFLTALLYRLWRGLWRAPGAVGGAWRDRKRRRGYEALSRGMVAVAAGDAVEAEKAARTADALLNEPPLTLLLSAQAAQLNGDEDAARHYFEAMGKRPELSFLGLRGRLTQVTRQGDDAAALDIARQAFAQRPQSRWVAETLFGLLARKGLWDEADTTLRQAVRRGAFSKSEAARRTLVTTLMRGQTALAEGRTDDGRKLLFKVVQIAPHWVPAVAAMAELLNQEGKERKMLALIATAWRHEPHPQLAALYLGAGNPKPLERTKRAAGLAKENPDHRESHVMQATAAMAAGLWGVARQHLENAIAVAPPSVSLCRLMAELEDAENPAGADARDWLRRATMAEPDAIWLCGDCASPVSAWMAVCPHCDAFDTITWRQPPHLEESALAAPTAMLRLSESQSSPETLENP